MIDTQAFPEELGDYLQPLWKIVHGIDEADSDYCRLTATFHIINFYSCVPDPTPVHFRVAREYLEPHSISDNRSIDALARELLTQCQKFQEQIVEEFSDTTRPVEVPLYEKGECLMPDKEQLSDLYWQEEGCNVFDLRFSKFLRNLGAAGGDAANRVRQQSQENYINPSPCGEFKSKAWSLWINQSRDPNHSIISPYLRILAEVIWLDIVKKNLEESPSTQALQKLPVNIFNVMLTTKDATLEKLQKQINVIANKIPETTDEKRLAQLKKQLKIANDIHKKASVNFPEDFHFNVYEQYAIYGGFKLLSDNKFSPVEMYIIDILKALNFETINKADISEIKKALNKLTKQKFPCYMIFPDKKDSNKYNFYDGDEPIFKVWEIGSLDLNIDLSDQNIVKKKLFLSVANPALLNDINNFYTLINSNLLAELRNFKKVSEDDLYFIAFIIKEMRFHESSSVSLEDICKKIKKDAWLSPSGTFLNREYKRQMKDKMEKLLRFSSLQGLVTSFEMNNEGVKIIFKKTGKSAQFLSDEI